MKNKRLFSLLLSIVILLSAIPFAGSTVLAETLNYDDMTLEEGGTEEGEARYTAYMEQEGRLSNLYSKIRDLKVGTSLNVAYLGGSITNGSGTSKKDGDPDKDFLSDDHYSWRALVGQHITDIIKEAHPGVTVENKILRSAQIDQYDDVSEDSIIINNINGAVGASSSYFGVHRAYEDIGLITRPPDVVFLEFTFNDDGAGDNASRKYIDSNGKEVIAPAVEYEGIIRQIYQYAPDCEIIAVFTTGAKFLNYITQDKYPTLSAERAVLRKYNLPYLYIGRDLMNMIIAEDPNAVNITATNYNNYPAYKKYIGDTVHPNNDGYQIYANMINDYIDERLAALKAADNTENPIGVKNFAPEGFVASNADAQSNGLESFHDIDLIKTSPQQIRAYSLFQGENEDLLSGFQEYVLPNKAISTISAHGKALASNNDGASLAFRFTGDSVGLWFGAQSNGGLLNVNVYKLDDKTNERIATPVATVTDKSLAGSNKPISVILSSDLEYGTYEVDLWITKSSKGSASELCRILWNGEDNIEPIEHPDIPLTCPEIEVLNSFIQSGYNYNVSGSTYDKTAENHGFVQNEDGSFRLTFDGTRTELGANSTLIKLTNMGLASYKASVEHYKYMFVEYFVPADSTYNFNKVSMRVQQTDQMVEAANSSNIRNLDYHSGELVKGEWATAVIDISTYMDTCISEGIAGATHKSNWRRIEFYPFGTSAKPSDTTLVGATIDIRSIRFSATPTPTVPEEGENGEKIAYVQSSGKVTFPDYSEEEAFTSFEKAFDALGKDGGTIIFQGEMTLLKDGTKPHGDVTIMGLEGSEHTLHLKTQGNLSITQGNVTFENLDISFETTNNKNEPVSATIFFGSAGNTVTFGNNVNILPLSTGASSSTYIAPHYLKPTSMNAVFNGASNIYTYVASSGGAAESGTKFSGHSNYTFNAGTFANVFGGAFNPNGTSYYRGYGDVNYTFNGGTYKGQVTTNSLRGGERYGNVIFTINGGTFNNTKNAISYSNTTNSISYATRNDEVPSTRNNPGTDVIIVNCKEVSETEAGALSATDELIGIGARYNDTFKETSATTMAILNNAELADKVKVKIGRSSNSATTSGGSSGSLIADYQIEAEYGKIIPIFEESSTDTTGTSAGKLLGFKMVGDTEKHLPYVNGVKLQPKANGLYELPENFKGTVEFKGPTTVYVNATGTATLPDGTTIEGEDKVFTTFSKAFDKLGAEGGIIYFQGEFSSLIDGTTAHGDVEVVGIGDTDELRAQNIITVSANNFAFAKGNVTLKNLSIKATKDIYLYATNGYTLTFGENVVMHADKTNNINVAPLYSVTTGKNFGRTNAVFSAKDAIYTIAASVGGYSSGTSTHQGHVNYVFNAGTFSNVYDVYNTHSSGNFKGYGDVNHTFNGGTFSIVSPNAYRGGSRYGNVIYTINGGDFTKDVFFGNYSTDNNTSTENPGAAAIVVNCKEISQTDSGKISTSMRSFGVKRNYGGESATSMVILNNAELANTVNAQIPSSSPANYKIKVSNGKATPVFEASSTATDSTSAGKLLGFRIESDAEGLVPCANGKRLVPNADGLYNIDTGDVTVTFVKFTEGDANGNDAVDIADFLRVGLYLNEKTADINTINADLNIDGYIDAADKNLLRNILLNALSK